MLEDIRFASRQLLKSPGFSVVAVLTLAAAIGASTAIFSAVDAVLLHPLHYPDPDRLMVVTENLPHYGLAGLQPSFSEFLEYRRLATCFSVIAAVAGGDATLTGEGQPEDADGRRVTSAALPMLGIKPILGKSVHGRRRTIRKRSRRDPFGRFVETALWRRSGNHWKEYPDQPGELPCGRGDSADAGCRFQS
jgi:hypothetical protein